MTPSLARRLRRFALALALAAGLGGTAVPAHALCLVCTGIVSATPHAFGTYDPLASGPLDSTSTVTVTIIGVAGLLVPYTVSLGGGQYGVTLDRQMANGSDRMHYNFYTGAARGTVWGDGAVGATVSGSFLFTLLVLSASANHTVYGRVEPGQSTLRPGAYADIVTVTVLF